MVGDLYAVGVTVLAKSSTAVDIFGTTARATLVEVKATQNVQLSCNLGAPERNEWKIFDCVANVFYFRDSDGALLRGFLAEIGTALKAERAWTEECCGGNPDFRYLPFYCSFLDHPAAVIPHIQPLYKGYEAFYADGALYVIAGCDDMADSDHFELRLAGRRVDFRERVRNLREAEGILARTLKTARTVRGTNPDLKQ